MGTRDNQFYTRLAKQTDLTAVPELAKIEAFAAPLASVITDKALRYKAALATAQSQGGLTKDAILKGFDALLNVLNSSASTFNKQTDEVSRTEVDAKIAQISDVNEAIQQKQKEIADLQQQVKSLQSQTEVSRSKLQEAKSNFAAALRSEEHTSELQSRLHLVCRLLLEKKKKTNEYNSVGTDLASTKTCPCVRSSGLVHMDAGLASWDRSMSFCTPAGWESRVHCRQCTT